MLASLAPSAHALWDPNRIRNIRVPKRTRASKPKVRTGCVTCKNRHVKCDERKPTCLRCERAGTTCVGYESPSAPTEKPPKRKNTPPPASRALLPRPSQSSRVHLLQQRHRQGSCDVDGATAMATSPAGRWDPATALFNESEVVYFDLFRYHLIKDLSGFCHSDFWSRVVLREAIRDECIRHAILAIGAISQALHFTPKEPDSHHRPQQQQRQQQQNDEPPQIPLTAAPLSSRAILNMHHRQALRHHMKATSLFRRRIETELDVISPRTMLVATLLFVAYELIQGNIKSADSLITSGVALLKGSIKMLSAGDSASPRCMPEYQSRLDDDMDEIEYLLPRMSITSNFTPFEPQQRSDNVVFMSSNPDVEFPELGKTSLDDAMQMWNDFCTRSMVFVTQHVWKVLRNMPVDMAAAQRDQEKFLSRLYMWRSILRSYERDEEGRLAGEAEARDQQHHRSRLCGIRIMQLHNLVDIIFVSCCLDRTGMAYDAFLAEYREVVGGCAALLGQGDLHSRPSRIGFAFDLGLSPMLGFVISTCRRLDVRMQAMDYFRRLNWREDGAWDDKALAIGKLGLISLEQSGADADGRIPAAARYHWSGGAWDLEERKLAAEYRRLVPDENGQTVTVKLLLDL